MKLRSRSRRRSIGRATARADRRLAARRLAGAPRAAAGGAVISASMGLRAALCCGGVAWACSPAPPSCSSREPPPCVRQPRAAHGVRARRDPAAPHAAGRRVRRLLSGADAHAAVRSWGSVAVVLLHGACVLLLALQLPMDAARAASAAPRPNAIREHLFNAGDDAAAFTPANLTSMVLRGRAERLLRPRGVAARPVEDCVVVPTSSCAILARSSTRSACAEAARDAAARRHDDVAAHAPPAAVRTKQTTSISPTKMLQRGPRPRRSALCREEEPRHDAGAREAGAAARSSYHAARRRRARDRRHATGGPPSRSASSSRSAPHAPDARSKARWPPASSAPTRAMSASSTSGVMTR